MSVKQLKLIIQIPCFNEADQLSKCLAALPDRVEGIALIEVLVVDDGSVDGTAKIAREQGVHHVVSHPRNLGLARAFMTGIRHALAVGADLIVNTDADNQYCAEDISLLVTPIIEGRADMVVGARPIEQVAEFSYLKKKLQRMGSWAVRLASHTEVQDATSGFRAISRDAAMRMNVFSNYTYTLETLIQAGQNNLQVLSVPVRVNAKQRESRLMRSTLHYVRLSVLTIMRVFVIYRPFKFFCLLAALPLSVGLVIGLRFVILFLRGHGDGHVQSLILAAILLLIGFQTLVVAFLADLLAANRRLSEDIRYQILKQS